MGSFKPHLATDADMSKLEFPLTIQYKIDGVRLLVQNNKATGRSLKEFSNKALTAYFSNPRFNGFDAELGATYPNDTELCRLTSSLTSTISGDLPAFIVVFDYLTAETAGLPYADRMKALREYAKSEFSLDEAVKVFISPQYVVKSMQEMMDFYHSALSLGYEGIIIRKPEGNHKNGRCTLKEGNYLRIKPKKDSEGTFVSAVEALENQNEATINALGRTERSSHKENKVPTGMIGAIWIKDCFTGQILKIGAGKLTHEERKYYFEHQDELETKLIKYAFLATGMKDKPRHARFIGFRDKADLGD
jgi:DNA ligase-1